MQQVESVTNTENTTVLPDDDFSDLEALLLNDDQQEEIIIDEEPDVEEVNDEDFLIAVEKDIEHQEEIMQAYEEQDSAPLPDVEDKPKAISSVKTPKEAKPKAPKVPKSSKRSEKIFARLTEAEIEDYTLLTPDWAEFSADERKEKFATIIDTMAEYVGDKAVNLFVFLKTGGGLNIVTARAFEVLFRDGALHGGDSGNIITNLLAKPYSIGTARSQANQMLQLFTLLEIGTRSAKGTVEINHDSVIVDRVKSMMTSA